MCSKRWVAGCVVALFLLLATSVQAQWVLAARAAKNEINRMTQRSGSGGYDVATVVIEADPSKVYDKTVELVKTHSDVKITKEDKETGTIEIQKGKKVAGFQIYALGDKMTQMVVASGVDYKSKEPDQTSMVVESIIHVCTEFNVKCTVQPR
jgi:hypothetical protein